VDYGGRKIVQKGADNKSSKKLINAHLAKMWAMAEGDVGNKEPLQ
jgi:hypothetical protein